MTIRLRTGEGYQSQPVLLWDTVWNSKSMTGDWSQVGTGLVSDNPLQTSVILCLFTDRRCPPTHPLAKYAEADPRGWWGDGVDIRADQGEQEMGSLLWLLERAPLTDEIARWAQSLATEALQPLVKQGAVAKISVTTEVQGVSRLALGIKLYARDGSAAYASQFEIYWRAIG